MKNLFLSTLLITFSLVAQKNYVLHIEDGNFTCAEYLKASVNDIVLPLQKNRNYTMEILHAKKILGVENLDYFDKNKDSVLQKYEQLIRDAGKFDSSISYEYYKEKVFDASDSYVKFFITTGLTTTLPFKFKGYRLSNGIYNVEIYEGNHFVESFYILVEGDKLKRYDIDYKLE